MIENVCSLGKVLPKAGFGSDAHSFPVPGRRNIKKKSTKGSIRLSSSAVFLIKYENMPGIPAEGGR